MVDDGWLNYTLALCFPSNVGYIYIYILIRLLRGTGWSLCGSLPPGKGENQETMALKAAHLQQKDLGSRLEGMPSRGQKGVKLSLQRAMLGCTRLVGCSAWRERCRSENPGRKSGFLPNDYIFLDGRMAPFRGHVRIYQFHPTKRSTRWQNPSPLVQLR